MSPVEDRRVIEFSRCFEQETPRLLRYAQRHVGPDLAQDVVADTFQIAWRRWDDLPEAKFPWLVGTARKVIANQVRSLVRRRRLVDRLGFLEGLAEDSAAEPIARLEALRRLASLSEVEREALLLMAWDGLTSTEASTVLGISPGAFRKRLSRARASVEISDESEHQPARTALGGREEA